MEIVRSVPPDVIRAIVAASGINDSCSFTAWKKSLSLLWVCREWRRIAEPILFGIFIRDSDSLVSAPSNYKLLSERRCLDKVTRVIIREERLESAIDFDEEMSIGDTELVLAIGELFCDGDAAEATETLHRVNYDQYLKTLAKGNECYKNTYGDDDDADSDFYRSDYSDDMDCPQYSEDELHEVCEEACHTIAYQLAKMLPNVTHLVLDFDCCSVANKVFAETLVTTKIFKLVKLQCSLPVPVDGFVLEDGVNIQSICLEKYDHKLGQAKQLPFKHIKNISLTYDGVFDWGLFKRGKSKPVSYDNLTRLDIGGYDGLDRDRIYNLIASGRPAKKPPSVVFPNLQVLVIRDKFLSHSMLKYLLQSPIEILSVKGNIQQVYQIYEQNLDNLGRLVVKIGYFDDRRLNNFNNPPVDFDVGEFVRLSNNLFAKTDGIPEVHCMLSVGLHDPDWASINWVHLTHFYISLKRFADQVVIALLQLPNVVYMDIELTEWIMQREFDSSLAYIARLKRDSTKTIHTKLEYVTIWGPSVEYNLELKKAIWSLKQYLPNMKKIKVSRFINEY